MLSTRRFWRWVWYGVEDYPDVGIGLLWLRRRAAVRRRLLGEGAVLAGTGGAIVFITALGRIWYKNPITQDKTSILDVVSFSFIRPWIKKFPSDGPLMKVADLPPEPPLAPHVWSLLFSFALPRMFRWLVAIPPPAVKSPEVWR